MGSVLSDHVEGHVLSLLIICSGGGGIKRCGLVAIGLGSGPGVDGPGTSALAGSRHRDTFHPTDHVTAIGSG